MTRKHPVILSIQCCVVFLAAVDTGAHATSGQVNGNGVTASSPHRVDNTTSGTSGEPSTPDRSDGNNVSSHSYLSEGCCNGRKVVLCSNCYGCSYLYLNYPVCLSLFANYRLQFLLDRLGDISDCSYRLSFLPLSCSQLSLA